MVSENYIDEIASQLVAGLVQVPLSDKSENQQPEQAQVEEPSQDDTAVVQQSQDEGVVEEPEVEVVDEEVPTAQPQAQAEPVQVEQPKQVGGIPPEEVEKIKADYEKRIDELLKDLEYYKLQLENLKKQYEAVKPLVENPFPRRK
jgi:cupin superfamily acireductone dioxygenase involved in methionine salvage